MELQILQVTAAPVGWWAEKAGHIHPIAAWVAVRHDYGTDGCEDSIRPMVAGVDTAQWIADDLGADAVWFDPREEAFANYRSQWTEGPTGSSGSAS